MNPPSADPSLQRVARVFPSLAEEVAMTENAGAPKGTVFNLANHVDYAEGSVVSKTLLKKNTGTITLFAFAAGQGLSEHTAPFDAV